MKQILSTIMLGFIVGIFVLAPAAALAQRQDGADDPNSSNFRLSVCDGPTLPQKLMDKLPSTPEEFEKKFGHPPPYVACDFRGVVDQVQHLINIMIIVGVLAAIVGITYAGGLYISGSEKNISKAKSIFPKLAWGFIIMLSAWFIVYQLLEWLTGSTYSLLG